MKANCCTLTERGQVSVPAPIRKDLGLRPGQRLRWEKVSSTECRVVVDQDAPPGAMTALGFAAKARGGERKSTSEWMRELREAE